MAQNVIFSFYYSMHVHMQIAKSMQTHAEIMPATGADIQSVTLLETGSL